MRLSKRTFDRLPTDVARFSYDRPAQKIGIVHLGIGAFHRAHEAWYTDLAIDAGERDWAICGVSLRSPAVAEQLNPQDGLYTLTESSGNEATTRLIGAIREVLVAEYERDAIIARIAASECHVVSLTVTEKGYARGPDGSLDRSLASASFYPLLAEGLERRKAAGLSGLTLMSCDNLPDNGRTLARLLGEWIEVPALAEWVDSECTCPGTMVDRIVPATAAADLDALETRIGLRDEGAVFTERFSQWVIEDRFAGPRPSWESHGAQIVTDVAPYETAKLRMLNGAHSALAYLGLDKGYTFVHEAITDPHLRTLVDRLMQEAATSFMPAAGQDLDAYADALVARFSDPALNHRLIQIAMDGSQKIPQRWLETLAFHQQHGASCPAILEALDAWITHVRGDKRTVDDPMAERLETLWTTCGRHGIVAALFGDGGLFSRYWTADEAELGELSAKLA